ncbi:MAG TPA: CsbD family protein [Kofleriaceae bacterium]
MSNESKRAEGAAEEIGGKIKKGLGKLIGNDQMQAEGIVKEKKGEAKQEAAKASERTKGKVEQAVGAVKNRVGAVIDNEEMEAEGRAKELEGEARVKANE